MRIVVRTQKWGIIHLDVEPSDQIKTVKAKIQEKVGISPGRQILAFESRFLQQGLITDYKIQEGSKIQLFDRVLGGGGFQTIKFNNLNQPILSKFSETAPKWRYLGKGLNLEGKCVNKACQAFNQKVWIIKGFGKFNMAKEVYSSLCPICNKPADEVQNMAVYLSRVTSIGRIKGESDEKKIQSVHDETDSFLTFEDKDQTRADWLYLEMNVTPL